jgi:hypothetical protein
LLRDPFEYPTALAKVMRARGLTCLPGRRLNVSEHRVDAVRQERSGQQRQHAAAGQGHLHSGYGRR